MGAGLGGAAQGLQICSPWNRSLTAELKSAETRRKSAKEPISLQ
jgi:hypothetical protein